MTFHIFARDRMATRMVASVMAVGFIGLGCRHVDPLAQPRPTAIAIQPEAASVDNDWC